MSDTLTDEQAVNYAYTRYHSDAEASGALPMAQHTWERQQIRIKQEADARKRLAPQPEPAQPDPEDATFSAYWKSYGHFGSTPREVASLAWDAAVSASREDSEMMSFLADEPIFDGYDNVQEDIYEIAQSLSDLRGDEESTREDQRAAFRELIRRHRAALQERR